MIPLLICTVAVLQQYCNRSVTFSVYWYITEIHIITDIKLVLSLSECTKIYVS